jgi:hypothetical protein
VESKPSPLVVLPAPIVVKQLGVSPTALHWADLQQQMLDGLRYQCSQTLLDYEAFSVANRIQKDTQRTIQQLERNYSALLHRKDQILKNQVGFALPFSIFPRFLFRKSPANIT